MDESLIGLIGTCYCNKNLCNSNDLNGHGGTGGNGGNNGNGGNGGNVGNGANGGNSGSAIPNDQTSLRSGFVAVFVLILAIIKHLL